MRVGGVDEGYVRMAGRGNSCSFSSFGIEDDGGSSTTAAMAMVMGGLSIMQIISPIGFQVFGI